MSLEENKWIVRSHAFHFLPSSEPVMVEVEVKIK